MKIILSIDGWSKTLKVPDDVGDRKVYIVDSSCFPGSKKITDAYFSLAAKHKENMKFFSEAFVFRGKFKRYIPVYEYYDEEEPDEHN